MPGYNPNILKDMVYALLITVTLKQKLHQFIHCNTGSCVQYVKNTHLAKFFPTTWQTGVPVAIVQTIVLPGIPVYCHMGNFGCGDGGWTLAMKIDGNKKTFHYDAQLWSDNNTYNLAGGKTGFDTNETKLPTYWNTSFSKICLGMMIGQQINFVVINQQANSLYSLIADGQYRATSLGRNTWKTLIGSQASLQTSCNKEGFNAMASRRRHSKARIGILGNQENDCNSCDSRIGFGTGGKHDDSNTCGNEATYTPDNGNKHIKAMGYILVQ
ncbi:hypothetical protein ACROYT_G041428 [Oculina patagonica]